MKKFISTLFLALLAVTSWAFDAYVDGIYYNLNSTDKTAEVTYLKLESGESETYTDYIVIPESVTYEGETYSVTRIGERAFSWCTGLTSVVIPNSVTSIGQRAFDSCSGLTSVTIPNSVTRICQYAFYGCKGLKSVTIPNSVTSIENYTFYNCIRLKSAIIGNSVTSIGQGAFENTGLTSLTIGNSVTSIGWWAFFNCVFLENIYVEAVTPPDCGYQVFYCYDYELPGTYDFIIYRNATLHVVEGTKDLYSSAGVWNEFKNITDDLTSGIEAVSANANANANARKFLHNGRVIILKNGKQFTADGAEIK